MTPAPAPFAEAARLSALGLRQQYILDGLLLGVGDCEWRSFHDNPHNCSLPGGPSAPTVANDSAAAKSSVGDLFDSVPAHVRGHLMPFQREGVLFALSRQGRVLIGRLALLLACFARAGPQRGACLPVVKAAD